MSTQARAAAKPAGSAPRRWSDTLDGIAWLPRLIDKARMAQSGSLGAYLFGHSPFDAGLLRRLGVTTEEFAAIVASSTSDAEVLAALRRRGFDEARVRRWSARLPLTTRFFARIWDVDDGYAEPGFAGRAAIAMWRVVERPVMSVVRLFLKRP